MAEEPTTAEDPALAERSWMLHSDLDPHPVAGDLTWDGDVLTFTVAAPADGAAVEWVATRLGTPADELANRLAHGESVVAFRISRGDLCVTWPKVMGGAALEAHDTRTGRTWLIAMDDPLGGPLTQTINLIAGRRKAKEWRAALT